MSAALELQKHTHATVYGPIVSPRFGRVLGINLLGANSKICSFNCAYCPLGSTEVRLNQLKDSGLLPSAQEILSAIATAFRESHESGPGIDSIIVSGNGEATLHPDFPEIVTGLLELRALWMEKKPLILVTNGSMLDQRRIVEAANKFDERIVKVDAGNEKMFKLINAPLSRMTLQKVIGGMRMLKPFMIETTFHQGRVDNTGAIDLDDWIEVIAIVKPKAVHVRTLKVPIAGLIPCDEDSLHTYASKLERRTGLKPLVLS